MKEIILFDAHKTRTDKTVLHYYILDELPKYGKGFVMCEQWFDDLEVFNILSQSDFGQTYLADFGYEDTYKGQARRVINTLTTVDGEVVFVR